MGFFGTCVQRAMIFARKITLIRLSPSSPFPKTIVDAHNCRRCLMRLLGLAALIGLSLSILGASAASADQCPQKESPIKTDRPDVTNSSEVVPQGSFQSENGINFSQRDGNHEFDGTNSRLRWGIAPCLEVLVDLPTYFAAVRRQLNSGFTNAIPAIKWQISPVPGKIDLSATLGAGLPTGTKAIAGPGVQPYIQFPWSWELGGGWGISGMFTNFIVPADPTNKLSTETTFVLDREFAERAFLFIEYVGDYRVHGGPSYLFNSGGGYRITPTQQIDFHVGIGLNENAPAYIFGIGYSFRLDGLL
jgi:Putative MetA-pathway of phenol degradation